VVGNCHLGQACESAITIKYVLFAIVKRLVRLVGLRVYKCLVAYIKRYRLVQKVVPRF